jgi:NAD(P)-dependent dehydrogenase (short-subunit alcohol dehydrogenase family)
MIVPNWVGIYSQRSPKDFQMISNQSVAVTGAAGGIGRAIAEKCIAMGAKVAISDINQEAVLATGKEIGAEAFVCDVGDESSMQNFINAAEVANGPIDMFVSNAGVGFPDLPGKHAAGGSNESWEKSWQINTMANVYASRALLPGWIERKSGRFVVTASAAGLLAQIGTASYTVTKHAALGFAEYMAIMHKDDGINVHCICPQYVKTNMTKGMKVVEEGPDKHIEASDVANALLEAMKNEEFLVLPHPVIGQYFQSKAANIDRYIGGMAKQKRLADIGHVPNLAEG